MIPTYSELVQGNIIRGFARPHSTYLFFQLFDSGAESLRRALGEILRSEVTSDFRQGEISRSWRATGHDHGVAACGFSGAGIRRLDIPLKGLEDDIPEAREALEKGMKSADEYFLKWNPEVTFWDDGYRSQVDGYLLLANNDKAALESRVAVLRTQLSLFSRITVVENGIRLDSPSGEVEHFGFRDGVSIVPDTRVVLWPSGATYSAFLKIEQNVDAFQIQCRRIARSAGVTRKMVERLAVGRRHDGTPLVPGGRKGIDDFHFTGVPPEVCPHHAHVRVMDPRDAGLPPLATMVRRGTSYGIARNDLANPGVLQDPPVTGSGLLFLSFQRSLLTFFGRMNRANLLLDPILSRTSSWPTSDARVCTHDGNRPGQVWSLPGTSRCGTVSDVVTIRGGEVFWVPGMQFIRALGR